jgi:hypothetical protein
MPAAYLTIDGAIALAVLLFAISQIAMAVWPDLRRWPETISTRSGALDNPVVPAGPTFAIWSLIFAWSLAFAVWQALPEQRGNDLLRMVAPLAAGLFFFNTMWEAWVPRRSLDWGSVAIILVEVSLALGIVAVITTDGRHLTTAETWLMKGPLFLFAGWASAATFVNIASTMVRAKTRLDPREEKVALSILAAAICLGSLVGFASASLFYAAPVAWALAGIIVSSRGKPERKRVHMLAAASIPIVLIAATVSSFVR